MKSRNLKYFILLLMLATLFVACNNGDEQAQVAHEQHEEIYTCPMHPDIIRNVPGSCPICGMDLVKKETGSKAVEEVELEALLKPTHSFVIASVPVIALEEREEDIELNVVGIVAYDTRQAGGVSSRVNGRIERLYVRYKYQPVKRGQKVMDIYSPELVTAQQNLLFLLRNDRDNASLIRAAKDRLLLLGMSASQIDNVLHTGKPDFTVAVYSKYTGFVTEAINGASAGVTDNMQAVPANNQALNIREGMYVQNGQVVFSVYNAAKAWVLLDIFPEQQQVLKVGDAVRVVPETAPHQNFRGRIDYIEPVFRSGSKTLAARVYFNNAAMQLPIGSRVTASVFASSKQALWLPKEAILSLGRDKVVFKKEAGGFRAHKVTTGMELNRNVLISGGMEKGDSVAANAQFLVDNEAFIKVNGK